MNQILAILTDVIRIATFQWQGEARRGRGCQDRQDVFRHHEPLTDRRPIRHTRP
ncbi:hypothetical protein RFM26_28415 [Mesorhizobium sp. VK23B]|uniref:Uncharacterized protein n=1 Tax=Mesorhizobium dulcispinae TaxID=3072316 RepID=A0ABU4XPM6_9HYPH|nr:MULTISPECIES: hypothetical protein [unclassified Mesorhizobium]MDX8469625.1 hypothetical protein [Mesorhizobium sp. VK23B]MDX8475958.1 hypothetical protein [Mesorhizobium sp. VK23A]